MNKPQHIQSTHGYVNTKQTETRDGINLVSFLLEIKSRNLLFKYVSGDSQFLIACFKKEIEKEKKRHAVRNFHKYQGLMPTFMMSCG